MRVPVGPGGPVGDEQLANDTEAAMTRSRETKVRDDRRKACPPLSFGPAATTSQTVAAMSSSDNASSPPPSIHWTRQKWLAGW